MESVETYHRDDCINTDTFKNCFKPCNITKVFLLLSQYFGLRQSLATTILVSVK